MLTKKFKFQLLKEQYIEKNKVFFDLTASNMFSDKVSRHQKSKQLSIYLATKDDADNMHANIFYDQLFSTYIEKTKEEDLFLSYWRKKNSKGSVGKNDLYRLMGAHELINCHGQPFGKYFIMFHFFFYKKDISTFYVYDDSIGVMSLKNKYYLTLEEIKNNYELVNESDVEKYINELRED